MARSRTITNEQILEAAREVFLAEGFGASTVDIARRAGVSEGSIFKRFTTKENLFFAAMGIAAMPDWVKELEDLPGKGDLKENLMVLSLQIIEFFSDTVPRMLMAASKGGSASSSNISFPDESALAEGFSFPPHPRFGEAPPPLPIDALPAHHLSILTRFFRRELELGRIRPSNPEILAFMLLGSLMHYTFLKHMSGAVDTKIDPQTYAREMIEVFWRGIAP